MSHYLEKKKCTYHHEYALHCLGSKKYSHNTSKLPVTAQNKPQQGHGQNKQNGLSSMLFHTAFTEGKQWPSERVCKLHRAPNFEGNIKLRVHIKQSNCITHLTQ